MASRFPASKRELARAQNYICPWCNLPLPEDLVDTDRDHIIPRSRGGPNYAWNRQLLHRACNRGPGGKGSKLTPEAVALAARFNVRLHDPLPTAWPGSSVKLGSGKPNPHRLARERKGIPTPPPPRYPAAPLGPSLAPPHRVTVRKVYQVECLTCGDIIGTEDTWNEGIATKHDHIRRTRTGRPEEIAA